MVQFASSSAAPSAAPASAAPSDAPARFFARLAASLDDGSFAKLVLGRYAGDEEGLERVLVRAVTLRGQPHLSFVYRYTTRDITKNLPVAEAIEAVQALAGVSFRNLHLQAGTAELQLAYGKKGKSTLRVGRLTTAAEPASSAAGPQAGALSAVSEAAPADGAHNRAKHRMLTLERPFLVDLGVTTADHRLVPAMARKWKQINRFIEIFERALMASRLREAAEVRVVDFGSGKGYLTFAVHDYLSAGLGRSAQVMGVELREALTNLCNAAAARLEHPGLTFRQGDVRQFAPQAIDVMIALHACDVATDFAIHMGIRAGAEIIMCAPCCHKEIRPQLLSPHPIRAVLRHGVHLGQEAEMITDSLRVLLLEAQGYDAQVFEFVSLEHTSKNKMILAVRRARPQDAAPVLAQIEEVKAFYGIREHCLETLLQADAGT
ncbi:MAG TPA: SAM-dependent methyltransferase [Burkholderiaceae bacterium]|nr:SAM-dependent methyltransferase [Burkholderiaceae bacterium]